MWNISKLLKFLGSTATKKETLFNVVKPRYKLQSLHVFLKSINIAISGSLCLSPVYILSTYNIYDTEKIGKSYLFVFGFIAGLNTKTFRENLKNLFISSSQLVRVYKD